jgi:uncharacterized protein
MTQMNRVMRSHLANRVYLFATLLLFLPLAAFAQIPQKPVPPRLVNDLAGILSESEKSTLEERLVQFSQNTSNQIVIVILKSLEGYDKAQMAYSIGQNWGVGDAKFNNGLVILIKPKIGNERGEAFIATGYGLEGALPDAICKRVVDNEMIPFFKENNYFGGLSMALDVILPIAAGEYSYKQYSGGDGEGAAGAVGVIFLVIMFIIIAIARKGGNTTNLGGGSRRGPSAMDLLILGSLLSGGRGRSGGFGGGFGSGGGGFGGFGGGGFGGGGAGGSW